MPVCSAVMLIAEVAEKLNGAPVDAITLGRTTFFFRNADDPALRAHEACHRRQAAAAGYQWYPRYIEEWVRRGYWNNRYEVEAREAEKAVTS